MSIYRWIWPDGFFGAWRENMTDIVERLCSHCGVREDEHDYQQLARECYPKQIERLRAERNILHGENGMLRAALMRIDGINDNPAIFNEDIDTVIRLALNKDGAPVIWSAPGTTSSVG